MTVPTTGWWLQ